MALLAEISKARMCLIAGYLASHKPEAGITKRFREAVGLVTNRLAPLIVAQPLKWLSPGDVCPCTPQDVCRHDSSRFGMHPDRQG